MNPKQCVALQEERLHEQEEEKLTLGLGVVSCKRVSHPSPLFSETVTVRGRITVSF